MSTPQQFRKWGEGNAPCQDCQDRCIGCYGQDANGLYKCERYAAFKAQRDQELSVRREFIRQSDEVEAVMKKARRKK